MFPPVAEIALTPSASDGCRARPRSRLSPRSCFGLVCRPPKFRDSVGTMVGLYAMRPSMDLLQAWISRRRRRSHLGTIHLIDLTARAREIYEMYGREKR
jgi:hypothetical protein